jgi:hypothetical protein
VSAVRWFVDENNLLLARRLAEMRADVVYPGHPDLADVPRGATDEAWLEIVGTRRLVVITRDKRIRYRAVQRQRWIEHGVRGFVLAGAGNLRIEEQLALIQSRWNAVERFVREHPEGPWMCSLTRSGVRVLIAAA